MKIAKPARVYCKKGKKKNRDKNVDANFVLHVLHCAVRYRFDFVNSALFVFTR